MIDEVLKEFDGEEEEPIDLLELYKSVEAMAAEAFVSSAYAETMIELMGV